MDLPFSYLPLELSTFPRVLRGVRKEKSFGFFFFFLSISILFSSKYIFAYLFYFFLSFSLVHYLFINTPRYFLIHVHRRQVGILPVHNLYYSTRILALLISIINVASTSGFVVKPSPILLHVKYLHARSNTQMYYTVYICIVYAAKNKLHS